jgi:hypothetical protein
VFIAAGTDDVEEDVNGLLLEASNDLDFADAFIVGLRYDVCIPVGASVLNANLTVTADEADTLPTDVTLWAERAGDAVPFADVLPSARTRTTSTVSWNGLSEWEIGTVESSPDLSELLNEVINDPAWTGCGHIVLLAEGTGDREAVSYDNDPALAPRLEFTYQP